MSLVSTATETRTARTPRASKARAAIVLPPLADALAWLAANDPKRAATYCEASGTVECWKRQYNRRKDGTIVGFSDGAQGRWVSYPRDVREYVATRRAAEQREAASRKAQSLSSRALWAAACREAIAVIRKKRTGRVAVLAHTGLDADFRADLLCLADEQEAEAVGRLRAAWESYRDAWTR